FLVPPPNKIDPFQYNGSVRLEFEPNKDVYNPNSNEIHESMGKIPKYILSLKNRMRGNHPICSFTAIGPKSKDIVCKQDNINIYAPFKEINHLQSYILLMGVDLTKVTAIHFAEECSGRNLFIRWARDISGNIITTKVGGDSDGFNKLEPFTRHLEKNFYVGNSLWRLYPFNKFVEEIAELIRINPSITHCGNPRCKDCNDAVKGGPIIRI
ncbi:MAG: AAC(3) family N-acetyltransferase, partial [Candidatus Thorarchaeota archaeon]